MTNEALAGNVVILTGASSGIGRELALLLAEQGASLALAARNAERLEGVCEQCRRRGGRALAVPTDVAEQSQCESLVRRTAREYGRIDTLINNAGIGLGARFDEIRDLALIERVMQVNFFGSMYCTHHALPYLKETKGRLVGVSSLAGRFPAPLVAAYAASKHAMTGFFDTLRVELAESGVSVTMIYPGWVATGISARAVGANGEPRGTLAAHEQGAMAADACARLIVQALVRRRREVVMTLQGKMGLWLRLLAPGLVDLMSRRIME